MLQAVSDIYLGWTKEEDRTRHYYWRQLRDMKGSAEVETMAPVNLSFYAGICGWTLAPGPRPPRRPHRDRRVSGRQRPVRPVDHRLLPALRRQNELDHEAFTKATRSGRLEALEGV